MSDSYSPETNPYIDKITLELLMNKNHYSRYLSQQDPKKHEEYLLHLENVKRYRTVILSMTEDFLDNSTHQVTTEVNEAFDAYVKTLIRHFECKKLENSEDGHGDGEVKDMLFGEIDHCQNAAKGKSFWGKHQVVKKSTMGFPMNYIPRIPTKPLDSK